MCTDIFYYVKLGTIFPRIVSAETIPGNYSFLYLEIVENCCHKIQFTVKMHF